MRQRHNCIPDYLVRLTNKAMLILEVKGAETKEDRAKYAAARRWAKAVTLWGEMGRWGIRGHPRPRRDARCT